MKALSIIMGLADLICIGLVLFSYGVVWWTIILSIIMIYKGAISFI